MCQINPAPEEGSGFGHDLHISDRTGSDMELMTCPGPHDPANYTNCCYGPEEDDNNEGSGAHDPRENMPRCCPPPAFYIDDRMRSFLSIADSRSG
ncbi:hypothetical protein SK128_015423 [Halocaridina rubra]|uniref:Uncharacterized protein n=1 Tax=Halocaridina rubra TaxID=373956 RepID=A0AAN8WJ56_HALRR